MTQPPVRDHLIKLVRKTCKLQYNNNNNNNNNNNLFYTEYWHDGNSVRQLSGRPGFNPRSGHTKDSKTGI